jgi:hypothetical protein
MALELKPLFAVPVVKVQLPETEALKQQFLPEMLRRYEAKVYDPPLAWETDRVHTSFGVGRKDQVIATIPDAYQRLLRQFISTDRAAVALWHSVYWTGEEYQEKHHHIPCHMSFIHFLAFDKTEHKAPAFFDPARMIKAYCRHAALPPEYSSESARIEVSEGDVLVFPSYLEHQVPPGKYRKPRVTVSMNVTLPPPNL